MARLPPDDHRAHRARRKIDGTLDAVTHEAIAVTSRYEDFARNDTGWAEQLYKSATSRFSHKLVHLDVSTPCDMRAPGAASGVCALECAMDELAVALKLDPIALRLKCYSDRDQSEICLYQQAVARMLRARRGRLRLEQTQSCAALDARWQGAGRLGHGDGRVEALQMPVAVRIVLTSNDMPRYPAPPPTSAPAPTPSWRKLRRCARSADREHQRPLADSTLRRRRSKAAPGWPPQAHMRCSQPLRRCARNCYAWPRKCMART